MPMNHNRIVGRQWAFLSGGAAVNSPGSFMIHLGVPTR